MQGNHTMHSDFRCELPVQHKPSMHATCPVISSRQSAYYLPVGEVAFAYINRKCSSSLSPMKGYVLPYPKLRLHRLF